MLFYVYDSLGRERDSVFAGDVSEAIKKARSRSNPFPMVMPQNASDLEEGVYSWPDSYHD